MIYKLRLPLLSECILENAEKLYFNPDRKPHLNLAHSSKIFKPEYLTLNDIDWDNVLIFRSVPNVPSRIHSDTTIFEKTFWGINWIHNGECFMDYWQFDDFEKANIFPSNDLWNKVTLYSNPKCPPRLRYFLTPGAYLVNANLPHQITSFGGRYCASLRTKTVTTPWDVIVKKFEHLIEEHNFLPPSA